jgi:rod shape-determining protein MreD
VSTPVVAVLRGLAVLVAVLLGVTLAARQVPVVPDLVLVLVVAWALSNGPVAGAAIGLAAGWVLDLVPPGSSHLGVQALTYAVAGALAGRGALAVSAPVDMVAVAVQCLLTATLAALVVPLVAGAERSLARRRYG